MNTRLILTTAAGAILWLPAAQAGSRNGGSGSAAVVIPADTLSTGGGASTGGSGANAVTVTASMGGIIGTVTAASPAVTNQQGYIPQMLPVPMGLAEALDTTGLAWTAGGAAPWFGQTTITHDGVDAARSGFISDSQESFVEATVTGPGLLNFWWKVSSEADWDYLRFRLDGSEVAAAPGISGLVDWQQKTVSVPAGNHVVRWTYSKDNIFNGNEDAAWLDQVTFTAQSGYDQWAAANIPAGRDATFTGDWNGDGILNGIAYVFGNTPVSPTGKGKIPVPPSIPADVDVYLDRTIDLDTWALDRVRWVNGAAPTFVSGNFTIVAGEVVDATNLAGGKAFYRYRVVRR